MQKDSEPSVLSVLSEEAARGARVTPALSEKCSEHRGTRGAQPGGHGEGLPHAEPHLPGLPGTESLDLLGQHRFLTCFP